MFGHKRNDEKPDLQIFVVYDTKAETYQNPILVKDKWDLIRDFESMCRTKGDSTLVTNAEDFQIYKIGSYFSSQGKLVPTHPEHVCNLHEVKSSVLTRLQTAGLQPVQDSGH